MNNVSAVATIIFYEDGSIAINHETVEALRENKDFILSLLEEEE